MLLHSTIRYLMSTLIFFYNFIEAIILVTGSWAHSPFTYYHHDAGQLSMFSYNHALCPPQLTKSTMHQLCTKPPTIVYIQVLVCVWGSFLHNRLVLLLPSILYLVVRFFQNQTWIRFFIPSTDNALMDYTLLCFF